MSKRRTKRFILQEKRTQIYLTKNALKRTSNAIFKMKIVDLDGMV